MSIVRRDQRWGTSQEVERWSRNTVRHPPLHVRGSNHARNKVFSVHSDWLKFVLSPFKMTNIILRLASRKVRIPAYDMVQGTHPLHSHTALEPEVLNNYIEMGDSEIQGGVHVWNKSFLRVPTLMHEVGLKIAAKKKGRRSASKGQDNLGR